LALLMVIDEIDVAGVSVLEPEDNAPLRLQSTLEKEKDSEAASAARRARQAS